MRTIIAGSRNIRSYPTVVRAIEASNFKVTEVVSGHAQGVDTLAETWAKKMGIDLVIFPANWNAHGKAAGPIRNKRMAEYAKADESRPGALIAVWDGESRGTLHMINVAKMTGLRVYVHKLNSES